MARTKADQAPTAQTTAMAMAITPGVVNAPIGPVVTNERDPGAMRKLMMKEFISGGREYLMMALRKVLPQYIDDVTLLGEDTYDRMLNDAIVSSSVNTRVFSVVGDGYRVVPKVDQPVGDDESDTSKVADANESAEYAEFIERCFDPIGLDRSINDVARELLKRGGCGGNKIAEIVVKIGDGIDAGKTVLKALKPKPRRNVAWVVDPWYNVVGFLTVMPTWGFGMMGPNTLLSNPEVLQNFVGRDKCVAYINDMEDSTPTGISWLRPAYMPWFLKTHVLPEFFKYLKQFASPAVVGKTAVNKLTGLASSEWVTKLAPDGTPMLDANGDQIQESSVVRLYEQLLGWMNNMVLALEGGSEVDFIESQGEGAAFLGSTDYFDRQITQAILGTTGMTQESQNQSTASTGVGQDVVGISNNWYKQRIGEVFTRDLVRVLILLNYGDRPNVRRLMPSLSFVGVEQQDQAKALDSYAGAYAKGLIDDNQLPALDRKHGLPKRDMAARRQKASDQADLQRQAAGDLSKLVKPSASKEPVVQEKQAA